MRMTHPAIEHCEATGRAPHQHEPRCVVNVLAEISYIHEGEPPTEEQVRQLIADGIGLQVEQVMVKIEDWEVS